MGPDGTRRRFEGRRIVVTGGGSGIGRAAALRLASEGASVAVLDVRTTTAGDVAEEIDAAGGRAAAIGCDVGDESSVASGITEAARLLGGLDGLVANAGTATRGWLHELALEEWERVLRINLTGVFLTVKHAIPHLLANGSGSIVTTGSIASVIVGRGSTAPSYAASKGGVLQLTRQIAVDYAPFHVRANCVCPGAVTTGFGRHVAEEAAAGSEPTSLPRATFDAPLGRPSTADEQAAAIAFLLSDDASFVTGSALFVDGGLTAI